MPPGGELLGDVEVLGSVGYARFDHGALKPFVEGGDGDPVGVA